MDRRRRVAFGAVGFLGFIVPMTIPQISPFLGVPLILAGVAVFLLAMFPAQIRGAARGCAAVEVFYPYLDKSILWICGGLGESETITAGAALQKLMKARPNSIETTESRLRDKASMGAIRAWGKKIPKEAIPTHLPSLEEIPVTTWSYARIDLKSISGPLATNRLTYLNPNIENTGQLYSAVRFNKQEIIGLCLAESI